MSSRSNKTSSEWNISTDIYDIVEQVNKLKSRYIEKDNGDQEDETTLSLGIFGFLGDTEAKKIQTSAIMAGELANEMFPQRAKLDKNVLTHAIYTNIEGINATPATLTINVGIRESFLNPLALNPSKNLSDYPDRTTTYILRKEDPIYIGNYEFHFDYDIEIFGVKTNKTFTRSYTDPNTGTTDEYTIPYYLYTARYIMDQKNYLSDVATSYLTQPMTQLFNNYTYVFFECVVRQVHITEINDTMLTNSIIDNKSYMFDFSDQLANFDVYVTDNGVTTRLRPYFYGSSVDSDVDNYCWYLYTNEQSVRIGFDSNSYIPGFNSTIKIVAYTTLGSSGNFSYDETTENAVYVDFSEITLVDGEYFNQGDTINCYIRCATDSANGKNRKTTEELKKIIPKMALSRGYITTETDLNNYFNLLSTKDNRLKLQKKVDNQLERIWYAYFVLKDQLGNIIPTNTIPLKIDPSDSRYVITNTNIERDTRYIIPCGTKFKFTRSGEYGEYTSSTPVPFSDDYFKESEDIFYYRNPYNIVINTNPLYAAYYLTIQNQNSYFEYNYVNESCGLGFTTMRCNFKRSLLSEKDRYVLTFQISQSINADFGMIPSENPETNNLNVRCYIVLYQDGVPYRYSQCELDKSKTEDNTGIDLDSSYRTYWRTEFITDDEFDIDNKLKLLDLYEAGYNSTNYGFFSNNIEAYLYICANFTDDDGNSVAYIDEDANLDIIPGLQDKDERTGWTLVDIYKIHGGLTLFDNYTNVMNTRIRVNTSADGQNSRYDIFGVPVIGEHFFENVNEGGRRSLSDANTAVEYFGNELNKKKAYINYCLRLIENSMNVDFKFFNTYGPSYTYTIGYNTDRYLDHVDLTLNFKVKLNNSTDLATRDSIIKFIKDYVEDINDIGDLHFPNLIHDIKEEYEDSIEYIDFRYFNGDNTSKFYDTDEMGVHHLILKDPDDPHIVPEFINVRNKYNEGGTNLVPCITVDIIS